MICPDLRGYGVSDKPAATDDTVYAKRTMAADVVALARALGHERFALAGHDRGALVAFRAGLDHPAAITHLACLDVLPTLDMWDVLHGHTAAVAFHLYLMAQPPGLPERLIGASADAFFGHFLDAYLRVNKHSADAKDQCRTWLAPLIKHLEQYACIGSITECANGDAPHTSVGAPAQAWSVAEVLRLAVELEM